MRTWRQLRAFARMGFRRWLRRAASLGKIRPGPGANGLKLLLGAWWLVFLIALPVGAGLHAAGGQAPLDSAALLATLWLLLGALVCMLRTRRADWLAVLPVRWQTQVGVLLGSGSPVLPAAALAFAVFGARASDGRWRPRPARWR